MRTNGFHHHSAAVIAADPSRPVAPPAPRHRSVAVTRRVATVAGLVGFVLSVLVPVLPVVQTTATVTWPQNGRLGDVTAPLIALTPISLTASIPCQAFDGLPAGGGLVVGTAPPDGKQAGLNGLFVRADAERVDVLARNVVVATVPRARMASPACQRLEVTSSHDGTFAAFVGLTDPNGTPLRSGYADPNLRPQLVGVFTDLTGPPPPELSFSATVDTRFSTSPSPVKLTAMLGGMAATVVGLLALWRLDRLDGRRMQRLIPTRWRTFTLVDAVVVATSVIWYVIGAGSSDDGYQMQMARVAGPAGYMSNYFRWFGSPEDPFGWYYNLLALMTRVSDISLWIRLPDLIAVLACWLLLSREVLPRLGPAVVASRPALWAAALVLTAAWMPFNNGLRPEGQIALGALVTYVLIERAIGSSRVTPAALAVVTAAFTLGIQPTGLIAVAGLIAGGRPLIRVIVKRHRRVGTWPLLAPLMAAGTVVLTVVFADQTIASVLEATRVRTAIGPSQPWYTENLRYFYLILPTTDGSLSRRFAFLITAVCLIPTLLILLRRRRIPGVPRGPAWRLIGMILGTVFFLSFTPTKWVHHFGLFAAVGAAMAALATVVVGPTVLRSARNRMAVLAAVLFVLALCFASTNGWWYVSSYGVPFNDATPQIGPVTVSTVLFALCVIVAVYAFRLHTATPSGPEPRLSRALTSAPIPWAAAVMVAVFLASMTIGVIGEYPTYSNGLANIRGLAGGCGLADDVLVEPDANEGFFTPAPGVYGPLGALSGDGGTGFTADGVPQHVLAEAIWKSDPQPGTDADWNQPTALAAPGVNGSTVPLPYGLNPNRVPVAGSFTPGVQQQSRMTSAWYRLPTADDAHPLVVVTAAGTISGTSVLHGRTEAQTVALEYGHDGPDGSPQPDGRLDPYDIGPQPAWRNLRFPRAEIPADATWVRIVADDRSLSLGDWIAITPPRVPELRTAQQYLGSTQPVLLDWMVGLVFPCQHPMLHVNGVTETPNYRVSPDYPAKLQNPDTWQEGRNGGLLGITDLLLRASVMPTYLNHDWGRDWGSLRRFTPVVANAAPAHLDLDATTRTGLWSPGPIRITP